MSKVTVFGASGGIGGAIVDELVQRGHDVIAASRNLPTDRFAPSVTPRPTDLRDQAAARAAAAGADVVVMAAQVPYAQWATELKPLVAAALDAARHAGARFVMVDNLYAYGAPDTPISEHTPEAATTRKGALRREIGQWLLAEHAAGPNPIAIGRFPDYFGPHAANSLVNEVMVKPAVAGKTARTYIDGDQPHSFHFLPDAARGFATLVEQPDAAGQVWVLPGAHTVTQRELLAELSTVMGRDLKTGHVSRGLLWLIGLFNAQMREAREVTEQFDRPYVVDGRAFEDRFGTLAPTPLRDALAATVAWAGASTEVPA